MGENTLQEDKELILEVLKQVESLGYVIVGNNSFIQTTNGVVCLHPINKDFLATEINDRLTDLEEAEK